VLDTLQEAKVYSTLDLRNGFFHVDVDEDCRKYTSFIVPDGQFEFNKVPFGLSTSPGVFQRYVSSIFRDLTRKGIVISYLDDLVIPAKDEKEGLEKLKIVFEVAKKYGLEIKFKKCQFLKKTIEFLGHVVENGTIKPSTAKTQAVQKFPEPTTIKQVQSFLGLTGYFRKYIKDYSTIAKPLSDLTRKENPFVFGTLQKAAFEKLKNIMSEGPLLHIYKYGRRTELHTDACKQGYGAILLQEAEDGKLHPVYYMSKKTNTSEEKYDSYELEVLAIINALKKFRVYLLGQHFKIVTDCSAFQKTMHKKDLITRIARWALQLEEFDYEIEHRAGSRMKHVDALSRYPVMIICNDTLTSKLKKAQEEDDSIQTLKSLLEKQESEEFFERNGILYKYLNGRELIVTPKAMEAELIKLIHENGHFSVAKTEEIVKQEFFIPNLTNVVKKVIVNCVPCILANKKTGKKEGFLNPISKVNIHLSTYHVDFIGPLPSTNKSYQHILTVVDAFTKFTWLYPVKTVSAENALEKLKLQQKTFGNPVRIITDRGSAFTSKLFNDYCTEENIQHLQIATGIPRGNGQVERIHRTLIPVLTKLSLDDSTKWYKYVDRLQRILNSTICRSTKWTPFELLIGTKMRNKEDIRIRDLLLEEMAEELQEQREFLRNDAKKNIETIQSENRKTYNKRRKIAPMYKEGDLVAIQRTQFGTGLKLRPKFLGPYKITKVNSRDRYEVEKKRKVMLRAFRKTKQNITFFLSALDENILEFIEDIFADPPPENKYIALKSALLSRLTDSEEAKLKKLLVDLELGDHRPSDLLRQMKSLADGILIASRSLDRHISHLKEIFRRLEENALVLKISKYISAKSEVEFLGHHVSANDIHPTTERIQAILDFNRPSTVKPLRRFLGMLNFYRHFLPNAAKHQTNLNNFLVGIKKNKNKSIDWDQDSIKAFEYCKEQLSESTTLAHPLSNAHLAIMVDASDNTVCGVL
ncbi:enzymatic polyprotein, partial [Trichonephila inaurata madagascariensis]